MRHILLASIKTLRLPPQHAKNELLAFTGLRGLAALWVAVCHAWYLFGKPKVLIFGIDLTKLASEGWLGVLLFFMLSGRLLATPYLHWAENRSSRPNTLSFLIRRVARVFPAYYVQLCILVTLYLFQNDAWPFRDLVDALRHLTMMFEPLGPTALNGVWWTLPVELTYYLLLPVLSYLVVFRKPWRLLAVSFLIYFLHNALGLVLYDSGMVAERSFFSRQFPGYFFVFVAGIWAASIRPISTITRQNMVLGGTLLLFGTLMLWYPDHEHSELFWTSPFYYFMWKPLIAVSLLGMVVLAGSSRNVLERLLSSHALVYLGRISYSFYLWHLPVIVWLSGAPFSNSARCVAALAVTVFIAHFSTKLIELPCMKLGKEWSSRCNDR